MLRHTTLFFTYELKNTVRNPVWVLLGIFQPVLYLLLFAPLLANTTPGVPMAETLRNFTPGVLVMIALFGTLFAGFGMIADIRAGVLERLAVSPASRSSIVLGRTLRDAVVLVTQGIVIMLIATLMGVRTSLLGVLLVLLLMALTGVFASSVSYALALSLRDEMGMSQILQVFLLPVMLLTGILLPMSLAPSWMAAVAKVNPLYYAVEAGRALFAEDYGDSSILVAFAVLAVLAVIAVRWSVSSIRRLAG